MSPPNSRRGFTLVELLVSIAIIGMLAGLALGGMWRADLSAKETNSRTTVAKVSAQVQEILESYRQRRLPIDPMLILESKGNPPYTYVYNVSGGWLQYYQKQRTGLNFPAGDPLAMPLINPVTGKAQSNWIQRAAIKLAATHELMRLELPCRFLDFTDDPSTINGGGTVKPVTTLLIPQPTTGASNTPVANPGGLSEQYRQFFAAHYDWQRVPYDPKTSTYEPAECLYMILKFASQNELGQKSITDDPRLVGDVDGDGMPEIQDRFSPSTHTPPRPGAPFTQHFKPISFIRWPAGFPIDASPSQTTPGAAHEIFDSLRIDPRAFTLRPLVYSGGRDAEYGIWELNDYSQLPAADVPWLAWIKNDPYYQSAPCPAPGSQMLPGTTWPGGIAGTGSCLDNLTSYATTDR